jgi:hypothetical protein
MNNARRAAPIVAVMLVAATVGCKRSQETPSDEKQTSAGALPESRETQKGDDKVLMLETIGTLAATNLYQTYLNIGFIADGEVEGIIEEQEALELLASVQSRMEMTGRQLDRLAKLDLSADDRRALENLRKVHGRLKDQADALESLWLTGDQDHGDRYEQNRKEAWEAISKLTSG